jgi:hypothetical protein
MLVAAALMGSVAGLAEPALVSWLPGNGLLLQIVRLAFTIGVALAVLAGTSWMLRIREFSEGVGLLTRRLRRTTR